MDFIAIDFETPNANNDAICSMGFTLVKNSEVTFNEDILIDPETRFDERNIRIHGIKEEDIKGKPKFPEVWENFKKYFEHYPVVMHNAVFDTSVLYKTAYKYKIELPPMDFYCTKELCQKNYEMKRYTLSAICKSMGFDLNAHCSGSDSLCTAKVMLNICADENSAITICMSAKDFKSKAEKYAWKMEKKEEESDKPQTSISFSITTGEFKIGDKTVLTIPTSDDEKKEIEKPNCEYSNAEIVFEGKIFALTGTFVGMGREEAKNYIESQGGKVAATVTKKIDYLIVGEEDKTVVGQDGKSRKIKDAESLIEKGYNIQIIEAERFVNKIKKK